MKKFTNETARELTNKVTRRIEKAQRKQAREKIRDIKAEIKARAKKGYCEYIYKIRKYDLDVYKDVMAFLKERGFRVWETKEDENIYCHITW